MILRNCGNLRNLGRQDSDVAVSRQNLGRKKILHGAMRPTILFGVLLLQTSGWFLPSGSVTAAMTPRRLGIVTGGTRGIGRGIAERLAAWMDVLVLTYHTDVERAQQVATELQERYGISVALVAGDMSEQATRDALFDCVDTFLQDKEDETRQCHLQCMVHNAGQYVGITAENSANLPPSQNLQYGDGSLLTDDGHVNFKVARYYQQLYGECWVDLCERSLLRMKKTPPESVDGSRGCLIGISSPGCNLLQSVNPGYAMPGTGKSWMEYSMRIFASNAAKHDITCNVVIPGAVKTEAWQRVSEHRGQTDNDLLTRLSQRVPLGQAPMDPTHIGDVVSFLANPLLGGRYITGQSIPVDAGLTTLR